MPRLSALFLAVAMLTGLYIAAETSAVADTLYAQYYPPSGYGYPPSSRPPCEAVTPGPFQGAARGAAGGALIGAISGNAGRNRGRLRRSPQWSTSGLGPQRGRMLLTQ